MVSGLRLVLAFSATVALFCGAVQQAAAEPMTVPYAPVVGETTTLIVRYLRVTANNQTPEPVVSVDYELDLTVTRQTPDGFEAKVRSRGTNVVLDRQRVIAPPDFDSLLLLAVDGLTAELEITDQGAMAAVTNWSSLRGPLVEKAIALAGDDENLVNTTLAFLPSIDDQSAVQLLARALAISAPGRMIAFDPPGRRAAEAADAALPSFATHARGRWSFDLLAQSPLPDSVMVQWLGVPNAESLRAILAPIGEQLSQAGPLDEKTRAAIEEDGQMWQRFSATYDDETGRLLAFQGAMELDAGPLLRRVAIEARAKGR